MTPNTKPGARGFVLPRPRQLGNPGENELLPETVAELQRLGLSPREVALDGGFQTKATEEALAPIAPERTFIAGSLHPARAGHGDGSPATGPASKAGSPTSNAATGYAAAA